MSEKKDLETIYIGFLQEKELAGKVYLTDGRRIITKSEFWEAFAFLSQWTSHYASVDQEHLNEVDDKWKVHRRERLRQGKSDPQTSPLPNNEGFVYIAESSTGHYKIGYSRDPSERIKHFDVQMPIDITEHHRIHCDDCVAAEAELHELCEEWHATGEWFILPEIALKRIRNVTKYKGGQWIMPTYSAGPTEIEYDLASALNAIND